MEKDLQVIAALSLLEESEVYPPLLDYVSQEQRGPLQKIVEAFSKIDVKQHLTALHAQDDFSGLAEIHPGWLLELLREESPRVIGIILRHLPSRHVRFLLEHLPKRVTLRLPKLIEAFYVPTELLKVIRRRVERHFVPLYISHQISAFEFDHLYYLKIEELERLFSDLGLSELALSLVGSSKKVLKVVLNRFMIGEAKEILKRMKSFQGEPRGFVQDARYSVLELRKETIGPKRFLEELGLLCVAKSLKGSQIPYLALRQRMAPEKAYLFKRYFEEAKAASHLDKVARRQSWILDHVRRLSLEQKIDPFWASLFERKDAA